jgi:hypothetical protein
MKFPSNGNGKIKQMKKVQIERKSLAHALCLPKGELFALFYGNMK